jgi:hypothetical protein
MSSRRFFTLVITLVWIGIAVTRAMAQEITVTQAVVCQEIVDRMPVGAGDVIPAGTDRVFCFTQIDGIQANLAKSLLPRLPTTGTIRDPYWELFTLSGLR